MSEVIVSLPELHGIKKPPPGKPSSKAEFLCLLYGNVDGNLSGSRGKISVIIMFNSIIISQELHMCTARL